MKKSQRTFSVDLIIKFQKQQPSILFGNYYDAALARFVTADTVNDGEYSVAGWNRYMYCAGNPVLYKDPSGHFWEELGNALQGEKWRTNDEVKLNRLIEKHVQSNLGITENSYKHADELRRRNKEKNISDQVLTDYFSKIVKQSKNISGSTKSGSKTIAPAMPISKEDNPKANVSSKYYRNSGALHGGYDIRTPVGTPVKSMYRSKLLRNNYQGNSEKGYGYRLEFELLEGEYKGDKINYGHLKNKSDLKEGVIVEKGQEIGISGNTGGSTGPHLHVDIKKNGVKQNIDHLFGDYYETD